VSGEYPEKKLDQENRAQQCVIRHFIKSLKLVMSEFMVEKTKKRDRKIVEGGGI
jgi:hypothetical protein